MKTSSAKMTVLTAALVLIAPAARAHMMPQQQGTLNVIGRAVFTAVSLPVSALAGVDDDRDGRLSAAELTRHLTTLQAQLSRRFQVLAGNGAGRLDFVMPMVEHGDTSSSTHVLVLMKTTFAEPPQALSLRTDLFGSAAGERKLTIKAIRDGRSEVSVLTPRQASHAFFRSPWQVARDSIVANLKQLKANLARTLAQSRQQGAGTTS
jgi:hypothetical protein